MEPLEEPFNLEQFKKDNHLIEFESLTPEQQKLEDANEALRWRKANVKQEIYEEIYEAIIPYFEDMTVDDITCFIKFCMFKHTTKHHPFSR